VTDESSPDLAEVASRRVGKVLVDKWRLERVLGSGGMATVYAASHKNNLRAVAIKLLHPELAANAELRKRFLREGYIANKVGHTGAVAVLDDGFDENDGSVFLVMDLLTGESLHARHVRARGALPADEVLRIADGILDVLISAHEQGIVHRDLKPDNVFITEDGSIKVLDFGIARLVEPQSGDRATQTGVMIGTPAYMPPEQARGRSKLVDERSDIWALGAIMYALLTGHHVHEGETPNEVLLKAMTEHAQPLAARIPNVDPALAEVVDKALKYEAAERFPDARSMREAVRAARGEIDPASSAALAATLAANLPVSVRAQPTPVTKASAPIVRDVNAPRPRAGKMLMFALLIGGFAFGASFLARAFRPAGTNGLAVSDAAAPADASSVEDALPLATVPAMADASPPPGASAAPLSDAEAESQDSGAPADADVDADEEEEEEDDGGEEVDELIVDAGAHRALIPGHPAPRPQHHPAPKRHKPKRPKKRR
jgi:hypothetical protein